MKEIAANDFFKKFNYLEENHTRFPLIGQWELTYRCNLKCVMCYTDCFNTPEAIPKELSTEEIFRIMEEIQEAGGLSLTLTGGEPLARRDFPEIYRHAAHLGFLVSIYSNGTLITREIVDLWLKYRPEMVEISMHGLGERFDEVTAVKGSFERCLQGVRRLLESGIPVTLKTVGMTINKDQVLQIKGYAESLGVERWYMGEDIRPALDGSTHPFRFQLCEEEFLEMEKNDLRILKEHEEKKRRSFEEFQERHENPLKNRCGSVTKYHIDPYGRLSLCSNNRLRLYDLRTGSFREGFFEALSEFPCPKNPASNPGSFKETPSLIPTAP